MIPPGQNPPIKNPYITKEQIIDSMEKIRHFKDEITIDYVDASKLIEDGILRPRVEFFHDSSWTNPTKKENQDQPEMVARSRRTGEHVAANDPSIFHRPGR